MGEEKKVKTGKVIGIMVIVAAVLSIIGGVYWYIYVEGKNNNAAAQNTVNEVNAETNTNTVSNTTDPYANYKDIEWTRTTSINYPASDSNNYSVWIDDSGLIHISWTFNNNEKITINSLPEKAKYIATLISGQQMPEEALLVLTENKNLYVISNYYIDNDSKDSNDSNSSPWKLNNSPNAVKIASNMLEIYKDASAYNYTSDIPNSSDEMGGTFVGVYALTSDGKLLSINLDHDPYTGENKFVLGLSYEECNSVKQILDAGGEAFQITNDNYIRDASNIKANYIVDGNNNKLSVKYWFAVNNSLTVDCYVVTLEGKIYSIKQDPETGDYNVKILNNKTVKSMGYNNLVVTVMYTDNTTDTFNIWDTYQKYGF